MLPVPQDWAKRHAFAGVLDPAEAVRVVRAHWSIRTNQHWLPDAALGEDRIARHDTTADTLGIPRRLALNLARTNTYKASIRRKIKQAGWDNPYLLTPLRQMR